jgi:hypothetical protein
MRLHQVRRIAEVLVASQLRSGRSTSDPRSFFGRGISLLVYDSVAFLLMFFAALSITNEIERVDPALAHSGALLLAPLLPMIALGVVLVAGVMFELTSTNRFATSDAVNWLPVSPREYVLGSTLAIAYSYSLTVSLALGAGLGVALPTGELPPFALAGSLAVLSLIEGGFLIEILRSTTQRVGSFLGKHTGRFALVARALVVVGVILMFQFLVNPVLLSELLSSLGSLALVSVFVPLLWGTHAVYEVFAGDWLAAGIFASGQILVILLFGYLAAALRERFWAPTGTEMKLESHSYGAGHPWFASIGFRPVEATLMVKDFRGLTRRRELLPMLVLPIVLGVVGFLSGSTRGGRMAAGFGNILWVAWIAGFYALLLSTTAIGQERRGLQNLYMYPVLPRSVFRAKVGGVVLIAAPFGLLWTAAAALWYSMSLEQVAALAVLVVLTALEGTFIGLLFAERYSDYQDRPRPQYLRPSAMVAALLLGVVVMFSTIIPIDLWLGATFGGGSLGLLVVGGAVAAVALAVSFLLARSGMDRLMTEMPF